MAEFSLKPAENAEPARWLVERLTTFGGGVLSVIPSGFEAYARVFHPAEKVTYTSAEPMSWATNPVCWAEVAGVTGRKAHPAMQ